MIIIARTTTKARERRVFDTILFIGFCRNADTVNAVRKGRKQQSRYLKKTYASAAKRREASANQTYFLYLSSK